MAGGNGRQWIHIPVVPRLYDWGPLDYGSIQDALDDAQELSLDSDYPGADTVIYWDKRSQTYCLGLVPRAEAYRAAVMRFRDGVGVEGPAQ